jgi:hypothetical protein
MKLNVRKSVKTFDEKKLIKPVTYPTVGIEAIKKADRLFDPYLLFCKQ